MLRSDYLGRFGDRYLKRFNKKLAAVEAEQLGLGRGSVKNAYANIIKWRHDFVHDGIIPQYADYDEARLAYDHGKLVIGCFCESLFR